jgi:hypothetical protein
MSLLIKFKTPTASHAAAMLNWTFSNDKPDDLLESEWKKLKELRALALLPWIKPAPFKKPAYDPYQNMRFIVEQNTIRLSDVYIEKVIDMV